MIDVGLRVVAAGGIRKLRPGFRKTSTTATASASLAPARAQTSSRRLGFLTPRASEPRSVSALNILSAIVRRSGVSSSRKASSACRERASVIVPIAS